MLLESEAQGCKSGCLERGLKLRCLKGFWGAALEAVKLLRNNPSGVRMFSARGCLVRGLRP